MKVINYLKKHNELQNIKINMNIYGSIVIPRHDIFSKVWCKKILKSEIDKVEESTIYIKTIFNNT